MNAVSSWGGMAPKAWAVPWDVNLIFKGFSNIQDQIGIAFNVGFWVFLGITCIYLALKFADGLMH